MMTGGAVSGLRRAVETESAGDSVERCADGLAGGDVVPVSGELAAAKIKAPVATADTQTVAAAMRLRCRERGDIALGGSANEAGAYGLTLAESCQRPGRPGAGRVA